ncbi:HdeD family acid-resistance protein [Hymenobacter psoromatis]|uniref:HdeD family acid-resistance protein n=1 Tax=Hymenobacter psoromatis TaxID=1484116 RepID=UPI001CBE5BB7|nr:DUF308 domain-containing protein [Hymenobacter psoromatis]
MNRPSNSPTPTPPPRLGIAAANWWVFVLTGLLLIGLSLWAFRNPGDAFLGLTIYFAAIILFNGVGGLIFAITNRDHLPGWSWLVAIGIIEIVFGFFLLNSPLFAAQALVFFVGIWLLLRGGATVANAFVLRRLGYRHWGWTLALGLLGFALAALVLADPAVMALTATVWLAVALLVLGVAVGWLGLRLRHAAPARG